MAGKQIREALNHCPGSPPPALLVSRKESTYHPIKPYFFLGPIVKPSPSNVGGEGSIPGGGARISHALRPKLPKHTTEAIL